MPSLLDIPTIGDFLSKIDSAKRIVGDRLSGLLTNPGQQLSRMSYDVKDQLEPFISAAERGDTPNVVMGLLNQGFAGPLTFAGIGAKTADKAALAKAQEMTKAGADPGDVWRTTGWTDQFPDKKWRFEISDEAAKLNPKGWDVGYYGPDTAAGVGFEMSPGLAMQHKKLFSAYPDVADETTLRSLKYGPGYETAGAYSPSEKTIKMTAPSAEGMRGGLLHEFQHAIQQREGFARGGSPEMFTTQFEDAKKIATSLDRLTEARMKGERSAPIYNPISGETTKIPAQYFDGWEAMLQEELTKAMKITHGLEPYEAYKRLAGEAEARLTQQRMNLTPEQRRAMPPWLSFDVLPEQQIVRFGDSGPAMMVKPEIARNLNTAAALPIDPKFREAVANTPGATLTNEGLLMSVMRGQQPEQALENSVRGGVMYLPQGAQQAKYYTTGKIGYGGPEKITGETLVSNPLFAKGATGGKAPERAYDSLLGSGAYQKMRTDALNVQRWKGGGYGEDDVSTTIEAEKFLRKYAPELAPIADEIVSNSKKGNQLAYALQEASVASAARKAGHDAVLGYSQSRAGQPFLSELFDVRERTYPDKFGTPTKIWPDFLK